jgi:hypothetical protein
MGHANRSRQHHAVSLDTQPWRICLSAGWSRQSNSNANRDTDVNGDSYGINNTDTEANAHPENTADTQTSPNTSTSPVVIGGQ